MYKNSNLLEKIKKNSKDMLKQENLLKIIVSFLKSAKKKCKQLI